MQRLQRGRAIEYAEKLLANATLLKKSGFLILDVLMGHFCFKPKVI